MIPHYQNFWRQLKPHIVAINHQDQIVITYLFGLAEEVVYSFDFTSMTSFIPVIACEDFTKVDKCWRRIVEKEGREESLAELIVGS